MFGADGGGSRVRIHGCQNSLREGSVIGFLGAFPLPLRVLSWGREGLRTVSSKRPVRLICVPMCPIRVVLSLQMAHRKFLVCLSAAQAAIARCSVWSLFSPACAGRLPGGNISCPPRITRSREAGSSHCCRMWAPASPSGARDRLSSASSLRLSWDMAGQCRRRCWASSVANASHMGQRPRLRGAWRRLHTLDRSGAMPNLNCILRWVPSLLDLSPR